MQMPKFQPLSSEKMVVLSSFANQTIFSHFYTPHPHLSDDGDDDGDKYQIHIPAHFDPLRPDDPFIYIASERWEEDDDLVHEHWYRYAFNSDPQMNTLTVERSYQYAPSTIPKYFNSHERYKSHDGYVVNITEHMLRDERSSGSIGLSLLVSPLPRSWLKTANPEIHIQEFLDAWEDGEYLYRSHSFCPASGRAIVRYWHANDPNEVIEITDFVIRPGWT